jgi:hypothetical protein
MMSSAACSVSYPILLSCHARSAVWCHPVESPHIVVVSCKWSIGPVLHCCRLSARLTGSDNATCSHVLQAILALASGALETYEPSYISRLAIPFFKHEAHGP